MNFLRYDKEYMATHQASGLAYDLRDLIAVAFCAFDSDNESVKMGNRGIGRALEMAEKMAYDLIDRCERMERNVP